MASATQPDNSTFIGNPAYNDPKICGSCAFQANMGKGENASPPGESGVVLWTSAESRGRRAESGERSAGSRGRSAGSRARAFRWRCAFEMTAPGATRSVLRESFTSHREVSPCGLGSSLLACVPPHSRVELWEVSPCGLGSSLLACVPPHSRVELWEVSPCGLGSSLLACVPPHSRVELWEVSPCGLEEAKSGERRA